MKKFAFLLFAFLPLLNSCSGDDAVAEPEPQLTTNGTILKRIITTEGATVTTSDFFYNSNKIQKIVVSDGKTFEYTYTGNLITKMDFYVGNTLKSTEHYQYDSGEKITQRKIFDFNNNTGYRSEFSYNIDGTVSILGYVGDFTTQNTPTANSRKVFLLGNGDVDKIETYLIINGNNVTRTNYYSYDDKNSTSNPIIGLSKIKYWDSGSSSSANNSHNTTTTLYTSTETSSSYPYTTTLNYTYNSYNYPITLSASWGGTTQYFYQQL